MAIYDEGSNYSFGSSASDSAGATPAIKTPSSSVASYGECPRKYHINGLPFPAVEPQNEASGIPLVDLFFLPKVNGKFADKPDWVAWLKVHTNDLPRLMREGFQWSSDNAVPEKDHVANLEDSPYLEHLGFVYGMKFGLARYHYFANVSEDRLCWTALLAVFAVSKTGNGPPACLANLVCQARVPPLSPDLNCGTVAYNRDGKLVYNHSAFDPDQPINVIYHDRPASDCWPWPQERGEQEQQQREQQRREQQQREQQQREEQGQARKAGLVSAVRKQGRGMVQWTAVLWMAVTFVAVLWMAAISIAVLWLAVLCRQERCG